MEDLTVSEFELCHSHAMTLEHLLTDYGKLASLRLRFVDGSKPDRMKQFPGRNIVNSNTMKFFKESRTFNYV